MNRKWIFAAVFSIMCSGAAVQAQVYSPISSNAIGLGLRLTPDGGGFTAKFMMNRWAIETQLNASVGYFYGQNNTPGVGRSLTAVALAEYNAYFHNPSWRMYVGPGMHVGAWDMRPGYWHDNRTTHPKEVIFGFDAIIGVEYIFKKVPIGLSVDLKPAINVVPDFDFFPNNFVGIGARYYFGHRMAPPVPRG